MVLPYVSSIISTTFTGYGNQKDGRNDQLGGGPFVGIVYWIAMDKQKLYNFRYNSSPIIACGIAFVTNGSFSVTFDSVFYTTPYVVASPNFNTARYATYTMVAISITNITTSTFNGTANYKDGRSGQSGGGPYTGNICYIAMMR
jgi:hypothetical protein